jgi:ActR/RegA family two-component response regulator
MSEAKRVLVVDDEVSWLSLLQSELEDEFEVEGVSGYRQAVEALDEAQSPFHLVVADISLRGGGFDQDGMDLVEKIREFTPFTSVIIVTGYPSVSTIKRAFKELDVFDYIEKYPGQGEEFSSEGFLERSRRAVAEAVRRRAELSVSRVPSILVFVDDDRLSARIAANLSKSADMTVEAVIPEETVEQRRGQLGQRSYDLVLIQIEPTDERDQVPNLIDLIRNYHPDAEILGVGGYKSDHKLIVDALTRKGVVDLIDSQDLAEIGISVRSMVMAALKKYLVASFRGLSFKDTLAVGQECHLVVNVGDTRPESEASVAIRLPSETTARFDVVLSVPSGDMEILPSSSEDLVVYSTGEIKPAYFTMIPSAEGRKEIVLELYRQGRWERRLRLERLVEART